MISESHLALLKPDWPAPSNVLAYTTTRLGGLSKGCYQGLNVGAHVGDDANAVSRNRTQLPHHEKITWLNQIHGADVVKLSNIHTDGRVINADASISQSCEHLCAVMTADCVPILLCDKEGSEVAAVHAGWQGLHKSIIARTIETMRCEADKLLAWIGPCIRQANYQVDARVAKHFTDYPTALQIDIDDKYRLDLASIARTQLMNSGIKNIYDCERCTYAESELFYSHRFATHNGLPATGRIASVIGLQSL